MSHPVLTWSLSMSMSLHWFVWLGPFLYLIFLFHSLEELILTKIFIQVYRATAQDFLKIVKGNLLLYDLSIPDYSNWNIIHIVIGATLSWTTKILVKCPETAYQYISRIMEVSLDRLAPYPSKIKMFLVTSCYRNRDAVRCWLSHKD